MKYEYIDITQRYGFYELRGKGFVHLVKCNIEKFGYHKQQNGVYEPVFCKEHQWLRENCKNPYRSKYTKRYMFYDTGHGCYGGPKKREGVAFKDKEDAMAFILACGG